VEWVTCMLPGERRDICGDTFALRDGGHIIFVEVLLWQKGVALMEK